MMDMEISWTKNSTKSFVHVAIVLFFMFGFKLVCPPFSTVTPVGVAVLGVFFGVVWGWSTWCATWASILGIIALGFTGFQTGTQALQFGFSNNVVLTLLFIFPFMYTLEHGGIIKIITCSMVNMRFAQGKPWLISFLLLLSAVVIGAVVNVFVAIFFVWSVFYNMCETYHIEKGRYTTYMIFGITFAANMGCMILPFLPFVAMPLGAYQSVSGEALNSGAYTAFAVVMNIVYLICYFILGKYVLRIDLSHTKLGGIEGVERVTGYQKFVMALLVVLLVILFWPSVMPAGWTVTELFRTLGTTATPAVLIVVLGVLNFREGITIQEMFTKGINWGVVFLVMSVMTILNPLGNSSTGIPGLITSIMEPLLSGQNTMMFLIIVTLLPAFFTNFSSNTVMAVVFVPIAYTFAVKAGLNGGSLTAMLCMITTCSLMTPAGSATAAILHGNKDWISPKQAIGYGAVSMVLVWVSTMVVGYPLGGVLF